MDQTLSQTTLANQPWLVELLTAQGFAKSLPNTFTNGNALIRIDGTLFTADPGAGDSTYQVNFREADRQTVTCMVQQILKMRPFLTDAELGEERTGKKRLDRALAAIALTIQEGPDTGGGVELRRFLWSLYNTHHLVNLSRLTAALDDQRAGWVAEVFAGALAGLVKERDVKCALQTAGEMERGDTAPSEGRVSAELQRIEHNVADLARTIPLSRVHTVLVTLLGCITEAQRNLQVDKHCAAPQSAKAVQLSK